jgi:hypothetical protein
LGNSVVRKIGYLADVAFAIAFRGQSLAAGDWLIRPNQAGETPGSKHSISAARWSLFPKGFMPG